MTKELDKLAGEILLNMANAKHPCEELEKGLTEAHRLGQEATQPILPVSERSKLIGVLATMPEEAFGWFVAWASGAMMQYPDGLGGFRDESEKSIKALRKAAKKYMETEHHDQ